MSALEDILPAEVVNQTKRGFTFPWAEWLRGPLKESLKAGLSELSPALRRRLTPKMRKASGGIIWMGRRAGRDPGVFTF